MVQIAVHNNSMEIVDYISNDVPGSLHYYDDNFDIYIKGSETFEFTVSKYKDGVIQDRIKFLTDDAYLSFTYDDEDFLMVIRKIVEDDTTLTVYAESFNLELLNEIVGMFKNEKAMTFEDAINSMGFLRLARIELGKNEIPDITRVIEFTSEETMLSRIYALVDLYGAEPQFITTLKPNGELDRIILNVLKGRTYENPDDGIGYDRKDIRLYYGRDVEGVRRTIDKTELFTALRLKDKEGNYYKFKRSYDRRTEDNKREIFVERNSHTIYAPIAMRKYPSVVKMNNCDNWIVREKEIEVIGDEETMWMQYSNLLAQYMYPRITYEIDLVSDKVLSRYRIKIGDTIYISDENFLDYIIIQARVVKLSISFSNPSQNKITLDNFVTLKSKISDTLNDQMKQMVKDATPYTLNVRTDNGVSFKEYKGTSTITPELIRGKETIRTNVHYIYYVDGVYAAMGDEFTISPQMMSADKCIVVVEALHNNNVVAKSELTFYNVNDGHSPILMHIETSAGNIFKNNVISTRLTARLWRGEDEIDIDGVAFAYIWTKVNDDGTPDEAWNAQHRYSQKTLTIKNADVFRRSMFQCDVTPIY